MGFKALIDIAVAITFLAASTGQLPKLIRRVQIAELILLQQSQASRWDDPILIPVEK